MGRTEELQRWVIYAVVALLPVVFWRDTLDVFGLAKAALVAAATSVVVALWALRVVHAGRLDPPRHPVFVSVFVFLGIASAATLTSDSPALSFFGHYGSFSGLFLYALSAVMFAATMRVVGAEQVPALAVAMACAAGAVAAYATVQWAGLDPLPWSELFDGAGAGSTLGNPNFVAAHLGIAVPLVLWGTFTHRWSVTVRLAFAALLPLLCLGLVAARSDQGWLAAMAGAFVLASAWVLQRLPLRRQGMAILSGAAAIGGVTVVVGAVGHGPLSYLASKHSTRLRLFDWTAAWAMGQENMLTGVGFDRYGAFYHAYRPAEAALHQPLEAVTQAPHSVPLNMFASGGVPLVLAWAAFVVTVAWALLQGLARLEGERLWLLGGVGGAWAGSQVIAAVSIEVPSLAVYHWILAAAVLVCAGTVRKSTLWLPWARPARSHNGSGKRQAQSLYRARVRRTARWLTPVIVASVVGALVLIGLWVHADVRARDAVILQRDGAAQDALESARTAHVRASWEPKYAVDFGHLTQELGNHEQALELFEEALERDPRNVEAVLNVAATAERINDTRRARTYFRRATEIEPNHPDLLSDAGRFFLATNDFALGRDLLERALSLRDDEPEWWVRLGLAHERLGDGGRAQDAYERALSIDPGHEGAQQLLDRLATRG